jgi:hypothetical protein
MILDPWFYACAIPAVFLVGLSKGGFGGSLSLIAMPLLALAVPIMTAAGIMLPILLAMDAVAVWAWRRSWHKQNLVILLPGAVAGTLLGWATATIVQDGHIRLMVGALGLVFTLNWLWTTYVVRADPGPPAGPSWPKGLFWGAASGFVSFISHVGGPPLQVYVLPQRLSKELYAGTFTMFFAFLNVIKIVPFWSLGQLSPANLATSAALLPLAVAATLFGTWLVRHVRTELFYRIVYVVLCVVSAKLVWDGAAMTFGAP